VTYTQSREDKHGREVARRLYPGQPCEVCGTPFKGRGPGVVDRHHRNSDRSDNSPENIAFLCRKHHNDAHRLTDGKVGGGPRPRIAALLHGRALENAGTAAAYLAAGWTTDEVADHLGVHPESVRRWMKKYPEVFR
jgi:5-methylcytosine-specific restriction endonuclease McrA